MSKPSRSLYPANFIVLDRYVKEWTATEGYQTESDLERGATPRPDQLGYEYLPNLSTPRSLLANVREQLQTLNNADFLHGEWARFVAALDRSDDVSVEGRAYLKARWEALVQAGGERTDGRSMFITPIGSEIDVCVAYCRGVILASSTRRCSRLANARYSSAF